MDYKRIIRNKEQRIKLLKLTSFVPDSIMLKAQYKIKMKRKLNLKSPQRWTEQIQWYKINYRDPLMLKCADKYEVRAYIEEKGYKNILNKLYGVYNHPSEIKYDSLPEKFVIKTTNGSGTNIICQDKSVLDTKKVNEDLTDWLKRDSYIIGREWSYKGLQPKIIIEEYLEENEDSFNGISDYKFLCFNGQAKYVVFDVDRHTDHKRNIYDIEWNYIDVSTDHPNFGDNVDKPSGFEEMLSIANKLAEDFPFVRVDLYWVNNKVYFGELTFYPWTGYVQFTPDDFDFVLGKEMTLKKRLGE
jgi:uncharacterized protein YutD